MLMNLIDQGYIHQNISESHIIRSLSNLIGPNNNIYLLYMVIQTGYIFHFFLKGVPLFRLSGDILHYLFRIT